MLRLLWQGAVRQMGRRWTHAPVASSAAVSMEDNGRVLLRVAPAVSSR